MKDNDIVASSYWSKDGWRGWDYNEDMNRYFFNDIPELELSDSWTELEKMQGIIRLG